MANSIKTALLALIVVMLFFGCINITQTQGTQAPGGQPRPPGNQGTVLPHDNTTPPSGNGSATGSGTVAKKPMNVSRMNYSNDINVETYKNKTINIDIYDFLKDKFDFSGMGGSSSEDECKGDCDSYCEDDRKDCENACGLQFNLLCANAAASAGVCQNACAAIPFPWAIPDCMEACQDEFDQACDPSELTACKNTCKTTHYNTCISECYGEC